MELQQKVEESLEKKFENFLRVQSHYWTELLLL